MLHLLYRFPRRHDCVGEHVTDRLKGVGWDYHPKWRSLRNSSECVGQEYGPKTMNCSAWHLVGPLVILGKKYTKGRNNVAV